MSLTHRKVHVFNSAKNNTYFINFGGEIGQAKSIDLGENFRIAKLHTKIIHFCNNFGQHKNETKNRYFFQAETENLNLKNIFRF
jgi:hypothetical protein